MKKETLKTILLATILIIAMVLLYLYAATYGGDWPGTNVTAFIIEAKL